MYIEEKNQDKMIKETKINLLFDEPTHTYTNGDTGDIFTSATTIIGEYKDKFNTRYWGMYTALKNKGFRLRMDKAEIYITVNNIKQHINTLYSNPMYAKLAERTKEDWTNKTDRANKRGNKIHDYLEDSINESRGDAKATHNSLINPLSVEGRNDDELVIIKTVHDLDATNLKDTYPMIYDKLLFYIKRGWTIIAEKRIYSSHYMIAGMIDVLIVKGKKFRILDWKSNKDEMMFESGYYKKIKQEDGSFIRGTEWIRRDDRMRVPLNNLQVCKGIIYSLQLSLYAYLMEMWGYVLDNTNNEGLEICHIRPHRKPIMIKIKYHKQDIFNMLEHHRNSGFNNINDEVKETGFGIF